MSLALSLVSSLIGCAYTIEDCQSEWKDDKLSYEVNEDQELDELEFLVNFPKGTDLLQTYIMGEDFYKVFTNEDLRNYERIDFIPEGLPQGNFDVELEALTEDCDGTIYRSGSFIW